MIDPLATPNKPSCPECGSATGISVEAAVVVTWRRGDWRFDSLPEVHPDADADCPCGATFKITRAFGE